jgi:hypothetical protein
MTTISIAELTTVTGGNTPPPSAVCNRKQFDWMAAHVVPDGSMQPGVEHHTVAADAQLCGFPMP